MKNQNPHVMFLEFQKEFKILHQDFYAGACTNIDLIKGLKELEDTTLAGLKKFPPQENSFYVSKINKMVQNTVRKFEAEDKDSGSVMQDRDRILASIRGLINNFNIFIPSVSAQEKSKSDIDIFNDKIKGIKNEGRRLIDEIKKKCGKLGMEELCNSAVKNIPVIMNALVKKAYIQEADRLIEKLSFFGQGIVAQDCDPEIKYDILNGQYQAILRELNTLLEKNSAKQFYFEKAIKIFQKQTEKLFTVEIKKEKSSTTALFGFFSGKRNPNPAKALTFPAGYRYIPNIPSAPKL